MSMRPLLTRRVGLCYVAAAGFQHYGAAGAGPSASSHDDDMDIISLGAMQPPLIHQTQASSLRPGSRPRPAETSFDVEESADQTLSRLLQHTFGTLGSALDDNKLDPAGMGPVVDGIDGTAAPTRVRWERERSEEEPLSRVVLGGGEEQHPASVDAAELGKLVEAEQEKEEEEADGEKGAKEEEVGEQDMPVGTGVPPELGSQPKGVVSTESRNEQGSEIGDAGNGTDAAAVVTVIAAEDDVDTGTAGEGCAATEAAVALEDVTEAGPLLDDVPAPVRPPYSRSQPEVGDASGTACVEEAEVGDAPADATASKELESFGQVELGRDCDGVTTASKQVGAFSKGGLGQDGEGDATTPEEVVAALSEGGLAEHDEGSVPVTGYLTGQENEIVESGPAVPGDALVVEDGGLTPTADGPDPIRFSPAADTGAAEEVATSGDAAGADSFPVGGGGGGGGGAGNAGAGTDLVDIDDASDGSAGQAGLGVLELGVQLEKTGVPDDAAVDGGLSRPEMTAAAPEIDGQGDAWEGGAAAAISSGVQQSNAPSEGDVAELLLREDVIGAVEGGEAAGDRSDPRRFVKDVPLAVPLDGAEVNARAGATGEDEERTTAVGAVEGLDSGEALTERADEDTSGIGNPDASAGDSAEKGGAGRGEEGVGVVEPLESTKGGRLPETDAAAVDSGPGGGRGVDIGEASGSPLAAVGQESVGSARESSESDAPLAGRLRPDEDSAGGGDAPRDAADITETSPTNSKGGSDNAEGVGSGEQGEEESLRERRVFRFSEPPGSRADGESAGSPGTATGVWSDHAKKFTMPPMKPIDVSPEALQKFRVPEDSREVARIERTEEWRDWGKRWAGVAMEVAVQAAKVIGGRGGTVASSGLQYCRAQAVKVWHDVLEPRTEHVRQRLETVAIAGLDEVGDHLADPVLAEAI